LTFWSTTQACACAPTGGGQHSHLGEDTRACATSRGHDDSVTTWRRSWVSGVRGERREEHDGISEPAPRLEGQPQLVRVPEPRTRSWRRKMHRHRECAGRVLRGLSGCERSRAGDAFRPPSPTPFAFVTEAAPLRERERVLGRQTFGRALGRRLLSHQLQSCERQGFAAEFLFQPYTTHHLRRLRGVRAAFGTWYSLLLCKVRTCCRTSRRLVPPKNSPLKVHATLVGSGRQGVPRCL
jgi:hypothetical protein